MRRAAIAVGVGLLALGSWTPAGAHPGHGAAAVTVAGDAFAYAPATATVGVGDTVIWSWTGALFRNHSVTADPGQDEQFDSDPGGPPTSGSHPPGQGFVHTFTRLGTFTYYCKNHPEMRGTVDVVPVAGQGQAPRIEGLRVTPATICAPGKRECERGGAVAHFRLSRNADVVARIARLGKGGGDVVESFSKSGRSGANTLKLPVRDLDRGRYELRLVAYDSADRSSNQVRDRFSVEPR